MKKHSHVCTASEGQSVLVKIGMLTKVVIEIKQKTFSSFVPKLVQLNQESWEPWGLCGLRNTSWKRPWPTGTSDRTQAQGLLHVQCWLLAGGPDLLEGALIKGWAGRPCPQIPQCQGEGSPFRTWKRESTSSKRPGHFSKG